MRRLIPILGVLFILSRVTATELKPFIRDHQLGVTLTELKFPEHFSKDLMSGLSNHILIRLELRTNARIHSQKMSEVIIKYDLWNEKFKMNLRTAQALDVTQTFATLKDALAFLGKLRIPNLWPTSELPSENQFTLTADALLNPIEKEEMQKIQKWVTQNSVSAPILPAGLGSTSPSIPSRPSTVFNKIFAQYASGGNLAVTWKQSVSSQPFRLMEVLNEK